MEYGKVYYLCAIQGLAPKKQVKKHTNIYLKNKKNWEYKISLSIY